MPANEEEAETVMRRAIVAVADAAKLVARARGAVERASTLLRNAAPQVATEGSDRAVGELEVAGRAAVRLAVDITSAGFSLATAAGRTSELIRLLPPEGSGAKRVEGGRNVIGRAVQATAQSAVLAEEARSAVDRAAELVREAAGSVAAEDWPRRIQADAAIVGARAATDDASALAEGTASARRTIAAATGVIVPLLRVAHDHPGRERPDGHG